MSSAPTGKPAAEQQHGGGVRVIADADADPEVAAILRHLPQLGSDPAAWRADEHGDLDWAYSSAALRTSVSDAELLRLLTRRTVVSVPAREYNPSAPLVQVRTSWGTVALPHGYRTPLIFVVKYIWESTLEALKDEKKWRRDRVLIFHLWRTCESLLRRAEVKHAAMGGMDKAWRCIPFDRLLTRFYKHSARCDPAAVHEFAQEYGEKEYERDVQKHDWKRWCMRGLNGVQMSEDEVFNGITDAQFQLSLRPANDAATQWLLEGKPVPFVSDKVVADDPPPDTGYASTSDLTDFDMDEDLSDADGEGSHVGNSDSEGEDEGSSQTSTATQQPTTANGKRARPNGTADDEQDRSVKRVRIENPPAPTAHPPTHTQSHPHPPPAHSSPHPPQLPRPEDTEESLREESRYRYVYNHIYPLTRTLAAMAKKSAAAAAAAANGSNPAPASPNTNGSSSTATTTTPTAGSGPTPASASAPAAGPSRPSAPNPTPAPALARSPSTSAPPNTATSPTGTAPSPLGAAGQPKPLNRRTFLPYGGSGWSALAGPTASSSASGAASGSGSGAATARGAASNAGSASGASSGSAAARGAASNAASGAGAGAGAGSGLASAGMAAPLGRSVSSASLNVNGAGTGSTAPTAPAPSGSSSAGAAPSAQQTPKTTQQTQAQKTAPQQQAQQAQQAQQSQQQQQPTQHKRPREAEESDDEVIIVSSRSVKNTPQGQGQSQGQSLGQSQSQGQKQPWYGRGLLIFFASSVSLWRFSEAAGLAFSFWLDLGVSLLLIVTWLGFPISSRSVSLYSHALNTALLGFGVVLYPSPRGSAEDL
ncbi:hypothetical protein CVT26_005602 [Gymnopilus dilepis]|uniref:Uncharacterized protein n=1 Tax=Gymnopilus dilepis TaxID=231916 RepID=A0A409XZM9_9AGAR|nr:hypothetical protein CVT26_005602 [Gymnopilus dilepis]